MPLQFFWLDPYPSSEPSYYGLGARPVRLQDLGRVPPAPGTAMLPQEDALPGAEHEASSEHRNRQGCRGQCGLDVGRHVVRPFGRVGIERVALRDQALGPTLEIALSRGIRILLDGQARGCVRHEDRAQAVLPAKFSHCRTHQPGDLVKPLAVHANREFERAHRQCASRSRALEPTRISSVPA